MLTAMAAIFIVLSIGILIAHALDAFRRVSDVYLLCEAHPDQNCNGTSHEGPTSAPREIHCGFPFSLAG
jgi:hypothetical protein